MDGAVLSTPPNNNRLGMHLKNAVSAICTRTLPKQRRSEPAASSTARHHTYPRTTPPKRAAIFRLLEAPCDQPQQPKTLELPEPIDCHFSDVHTSTVSNGVVKLKGTLAR